MTRFFLLLSLWAIFSVEAQTYPVKPMRVRIARTLSDELAKSFGRPFVIEDRLRAR